MTTSDTAVHTQPFQAEVSELLHLMVHSVYSETDIFLRELVSNASDACDKLRYEAIANPALLGEGDALKIRIIPNKTAGTLAIADNGIGMERQELIDHLGTIARSGTKAFVSKLKEAKDGLGLIGQFGVGFYSAFMVADKIVVVSRRAGESDVWTWTSSGGSGFEIARASEEDAGRVAPRSSCISRTMRRNISKLTRSNVSSALIPTTSSSPSSSCLKGANRVRSILRARCGSARNPSSRRKTTRRPISRSPPPSTIPR
jgi:hypothetical protein